MRSPLGPSILVVAAGLLASPALAGAWTQEKGDGYWQFSQRATRVGFYYDADGARVPIPTLTDLTSTFYFEYGASARVTPFAYVPFVERLTLASGDSLTSVADVDLGARIALLRKGRGVLSLQLTLGVPSGHSDPVQGLVTGDGEWNGIAMLQAGRSFAKAPVYISGEVGFNERTRGFSDEVRFGGEVGWTFHPRWSLTGRIRGVRSLHDGRPDAGTGTLGLYANDVEYLILTPQIAFSFRKDAWIAATVDTANGVRNSIGGPTYAITVSWKSRAAR